MGWNSKCPEGGPAGFTNSTAAVVVGNGDFSQSVYVTEPTDVTKWAYTYVDYTDTNMQKWRLCVVGHAHMKDGKYETPGNSFIPGWEGWDTPTPVPDAKQIAGLPCAGSFPDNARYPAKLA
ncbi:MAG: hypothetical protein FD167_310 [bacterium]|nr:MAG: hypothetical protein FD167_310 [bacterium]